VPKTENSAPALIDKAGIHHNLKASVCLKEGDYKSDDMKGQKWHGFELTLTNPEGLQLIELYFMPPQKEEDVSDKITMKKYELVEGKNVETRDQTKREILITLNNEFLAFLIDLGEAFGYSHKDVEDHLYKNTKKGFMGLAQAFLDKFKPAETTRISAKLLWENSTKKETSFLKAHGSFCVYSPFGNDFFDVYKEGRQTLLKLSQWEAANKTVKKYTNTSDAPSNTSGVNKAAANTGGFKPHELAQDDDPF
jgi:hypothetical protein